MSHIGLLFPNQLFKTPLFPKEVEKVYILENDLFFTQYPFHKQKLVIHRASMKAYSKHLDDLGYNSIYIEANDLRAQIKYLIAHLSAEKISSIHYINPVDNWLEKQLKST